MKDRLKAMFAKTDWFRVVGILLISFVLISVLVWAGKAFGATADITWTNATQRVDGTPIANGELVETQIEYGKCVNGNEFPPTIDGTQTTPWPGTQALIEGLSYGTWCFRARHKDSEGLHSDYAGPVWAKYVAPPKPPTLLTVQGIAWEMRFHPVNGPYLSRVIGTVPAGKPCLGLAPVYGHDIFPINPSDADLNRKPNPNATVVAQCEIS